MTKRTDKANRSSKVKPGDRVIYVPTHANGDPTHPDCEDGLVTSVNSHYVFVRYGPDLAGVATSPDMLAKDDVA